MVVNQQYAVFQQQSARDVGLKMPPPFIELSEENYLLVETALGDLQRWVAQDYPNVPTLDKLLTYLDRTLAHRYQLMRPTHWRNFDFTRLEPPAYASPNREKRPNAATSRSHQDVKRLQTDIAYIKKQRHIDDSYFRQIHFDQMKNVQGQVSKSNQRYFLRLMEWCGLYPIKPSRL